MGCFLRILLGFGAEDGDDDVLDRVAIKVRLGYQDILFHILFNQMRVGHQISNFNLDSVQLDPQRGRAVPKIALKVLRKVPDRHAHRALWSSWEG